VAARSDEDQAGGGGGGSQATGATEDPSTDGAVETPSEQHD